MTGFIARKLTPEKEQAKREQIAKEDALVAQADLEAYRQFGFNPDDPDQADIIRKIIRIRKHMTTYDVFGHKLLETGVRIKTQYIIYPFDQPTDEELVSAPIAEHAVSWFQMTWQLDGGVDYVAKLSTEMFTKASDYWIVHTPMRDEPYEIQTGDVYDDMDCVYGTIVGSYMFDNQMFKWQKE